MAITASPHEPAQTSRPLVREMLARAAVGAVALPVVGLLLWLGGGWSAALFASAAAIAAYELYRLTAIRDHRARWIGIAAASALAMLSWIAPQVWPQASLAVVGATSIATWTTLLLVGPRAEAPAFAGLVLGGLAFVATGFVALAVLRARPDGLVWTIAVLVTVWSNDTGAFLGGKLLGSHRLLPAVSPGKTREGLVIGGVVGIAAAFAVHAISPSLTRIDAIALGLFACVLGPIGDLCKSMLKRAAGVKDSGRLFHAHGGMLDRMDAVLFVAPATLIYIALAHP